MSVSILIGGDVVPTESNLDRFINGKDLWDNEILRIRKEADLAVFNLECPLIDEGSPIEKCGPNIKAPVCSVTGISAFHPDAVGLGNNHILDYGSAGLNRTVSILADHNILSFGAGENLYAADLPLYLERNGRRIGFYAVAEHEFSFAKENSAGANPLNPYIVRERVREIRSGCDYLILLYHGGREHYPFPSPDLQRTCRYLATAGANLVVCQHSHCIGSRENYSGTEIVYGQGNLLFDAQDAEDSFRRGLLIWIQIHDDFSNSIEFIPVKTDRGRCCLAGEQEKDKILQEFEERSLKISDPNSVELLYREYAERQRERMMKVFLNGNPLLKAINVLYGRNPSKVYSRQAQLALLNSLECESLRELLCQAMEADRE